MQKIKDIARKIGIKEGELIYYGDYIAKLDIKRKLSEPNGKLILVTAITPTKYGEGKTTMSIGLADALSILKKKTMLCLREPSLGPVFSQKGGAAGGGLAGVEPAEEINLHFTGDIHAITSAHNLICAEIDNHIFWGNQLGIQEVYWKRAVDLCDRALRQDFMITAASEVMAIFALAQHENDLKNRLNTIVIGCTTKFQPVTVKDLKIADNLLRLLRPALKPNLAQTKEGTPALIHGGPFANIAHGTNSLIADKLALSLTDYVVTEAGFGSDLGGFKFFDLITRIGKIQPSSVVIVATTRAVQETGIENIGRHIEIMQRLGARPIVVINRFKQDGNLEIEKLINYCKDLGVDAAVSKAFAKGGKGSVELAKLVIKNSAVRSRIKYIYALSDSLPIKAMKAAKEIFGARNVKFAKSAAEKIKLYDKWGYGKLPICFAKTQYSLSDDKKQPRALRDFEITVTDARLSAGAGFVVLYCGSVLVMPGMPKKF
jgi:formate--tetrahydrofolate ligase